MGKRKFKNYVNYKKKIKSENQNIGKRIVGYIIKDSQIYRSELNSIPVYGSKSNLVIPLTFRSLSPLDLYDKKEIEYKKIELNIFKKYTIYNLYKDLWDE